MTRVRGVLFPDPPRRIPGHRWLSVSLRTAHLITFGTLLGGHVFKIDRSRLVPFLAATILTGAGAGSRDPTDLSADSTILSFPAT